MSMFRIFFLMACLFLSFVLGSVFFILHNKVVDFSALEQYNTARPAILLDDEGNEWARFQVDRREPVSLDRMPKNLINALIAIEDWKFFSHCGLSFKGIVRAIWRNICSGRMKQGASTITQQLVRLLFFDAKKTFKRKIKEQIYTLLVEYQFSKEQIIETYLNHVCFGRGVYGVQAACKRFWQKDISQITLGQAALLAGNIQRPERFWPFTYPLSAQRRRNAVLFNMKKLGFITNSEYEQAKSMPVQVKNSDQCNIAPYLKEYIRIFLQNIVGKEKLYTGGYIVQTTLNKKMQELANKSFEENICKIRKKISDEVNGALISIDVQTGGVKALIGGADFKRSQYNRVFQAKRQMGSVFKPILYSTALLSGLRFSDVEIDEPLEVDFNGQLWRPKNAYGDFDGKMTLAWGLSVSNNILAIKTLLKVGIEKVINLAKKFNLSCDFKPYPSIALGCVDVTLKESTAMFNTFANNGIYVEPYCVKWIKNNVGEKIFKHKYIPQKVINAKISGQVSKVLQLGLARIKKYFPQKWVDCEAISKTGTTNDSRVCWFIGATPMLTTGVYIGRDDNQPMGKNIYPLRTAFPIWIGLNRELDFNTKKFSYDPSLQEVCINKNTGQLLSKVTDPHAIKIFA